MSKLVRRSIEVLYSARELIGANRNITPHAMKEFLDQYEFPLEDGMTREQLLQESQAARPDERWSPTRRMIVAALLLDYP